MLFVETVQPDTFSLLKELMQIPALKQFQLVGGTALALQFGHRVSDDLDLFSHTTFKNEDIIDTLNLHFPQKFKLHSAENNKLGVFCYINDIKVDICRHDGQLIDKISEVEDIRMWGLKDIAASKVNAVSRRATKKDFWDIDVLLDVFSIEEIAEFYSRKYNPALAIAVAKMITYFTDAEKSQTPRSLHKKTWNAIKKSIFKKINNNSK